MSDMPVTHNMTLVADVHVGAEAVDMYDAPDDHATVAPVASDATVSALMSKGFTVAQKLLSPSFTHPKPAGERSRFHCDLHRRSRFGSTHRCRTGSH